jgi:hypothetical protein
LSAVSNVRKGGAVVEMVCIFADCATTTKQKPVWFGNQRMLAELLYDMCVTLPTLLKNIFNTWLAASDC